MTVVTVEGQRFRFPESMSKDEIKAVLRQKFPQPAAVPSVSAQTEQVEPDYLEAAGGIAQNMSAQVASGLAGLADSAINGAESGANTVQTVQGDLSANLSPEGKKGVEKVGDLIQMGVDIANVPISGLAGLAELIGGQGFDQAANTVENVQSEGLGNTLGDRVLEETDSPLAATMAKIAPDAVLSYLGLRSGSSVRRSYQSPVQKKIADKLASGIDDADTAKFKLVDPAPTGSKSLIEAIGFGGPKVAKDAKAVQAIKQGFDESVIAAVKGAGQTDKSNMLRMVESLEQGKKNARFSMQNRPADIVGESLVKRVDAVLAQNKAAGSQIDGIAKSLKGQQVDVSQAVSKFIDDLDGLDVSIDGSLNPVFKNSMIEGLAGPEQAITRIISRMKNTKVPDAYDVHRLKKFIDEQVTYGKNAEGLGGTTEGLLKSLRRDLDGALDARFPEYNKVNTVYAETIDALDSIQDAAGKKLNFTGKNADKATGTLLRRLMSNVQSRVNLIDSIDDIDRIAKRSGPFNDDLMTQVLFADELDAVFKPVARSSFQGQIGQAVKRGAEVASGGRTWTDLVVDGLTSKANSLRGINEGSAIQAIKELLSDAP